jgi:CHAT domain
MDVFFLAFSNSQQNPLPNLKAESQAIYKSCLRKATEKNFMPVYEPFASIERINEMMDDCIADIAVFLYSGHAHGTTILMDDVEGSLRGIALKLKSSVESGKLKLVILNACATKAAVQVFLDMGAPVVIATQAPVDDLAACEFSKSFFRTLCNEKSIMQAFTEGLGSAQNADGSLALANKIVRAAGFLQEISAGPLWEIFSSEPAYTTLSVVTRQETKQMFRSNHKLLKTVYTSFYNAGNEKVVDLWNREKDRNTTVDQSDIETAITNSIPRPIGFQLEKLLREDIRNEQDDYDKALCIQLSEVYQSANEFIAIVMIAQLWELVLFSKYKGPICIVPEPLQNSISAYFYMDAKERKLYNYAPLVISIRNFLQQVSTADGPLKDFLLRQSVVKDLLDLDAKAYGEISGKLAELRTTLYENNTTGSLDKIFLDCEDSLCELIDLFSFIHRYKLNSVRVIEAVKNRYDHAARFSHTVHNLNQTIHDRRDNIVNSKYLDSHCVAIILKSDNDCVLDYLSLSPFIVDTTVFDVVANKSVLNIFDGFIGDSNFLYRDIRKPSGSGSDRGINSDNLRKKISNELNSFRQDILGENGLQNLSSAV